MYSRIGSQSPRVRPQASRVGGVLWLVLMVGMSIAFFVALFADRLEDVWQWARDLPLLVELVLWLLTFPWLLGTAVWESSWASWLRVLLVVTFAVASTLPDACCRGPTQAFSNSTSMDSTVRSSMSVVAARKHGRNRRTRSR